MADEGASPREQLMEACRRNNTELLSHLLSSGPLGKKPEQIAKFLNTTTDALGASALHVAAQYGSYEVLDVILDQEGVEIDGQEMRDGDTCLHRAVRHCNEIRNKAKLRPIELVDPRNKELRTALQTAEMAIMAGGDVVVEDDDAPNGPGSESD
ncbi:hypothetical protein LTR10_002000 [Elasticomyces elasticus]|nr:hypothetical protein LTR10_002000 [Elasticomyces elasticus]KAK4973928.1 hypothetical protein LTR42_005918 [Elasticomyces elasticus]